MKINSKIIAYFLLFWAIIAEVIATAFLKIDIGRFYSYAFMMIFITISYYLMALAVRKIYIGVAYAMWEILGSSLIVLMSILLFDEILTTTQIIGIILALIGIILINIGERH